MYILYIWTIVAFSNQSAYSSREHRDWKAEGVFTSAAACQNAATALGKDANNARCIPTSTK